MFCFPWLRNKNPRSGKPDRGKESLGIRQSGLFDGNRILFTDLNTALAAKALFRIDRNGLAVLHLENFSGAHINTFFAARTFILIDTRDKSHFETSPFSVAVEGGLGWLTT
jgi:hypothetical protein